MIPAPYPENEEKRLLLLREYDILDTLPEEEYDSVTKLAALICNVPIALISLIDARRQWFKSKIGLDAVETPRNLAFCGHAILSPDKLLVVEDAMDDERFSDHPLVTGPPNIRFYAGYPLSVATGESFGTLCVIDTVARQLSDAQKEALEILAGQVVSSIESRGQRKKLLSLTQQLEAANELKAVDINARIAAESEFKEINEMYHLIVEESPDLIFVKDSSYRFVKANRALISAFPENIRGSVIGSTALESFTDEEAAGYLANDRKAFEDGACETVETATFGRDYTTTFYTKKVRFTNAKGEDFILGVARDITEIKLTEDALLKSNGLTHAILSSASHMIIATDIMGNIILFNKEAERLLGYRSQDVIQKVMPISGMTKRKLKNARSN